MNNHESPSPKDALWKVWLTLAQWSWKRRIFKFRQCIFAISLLSPLEKRCGHSFEQTWSPYHMNALYRIRLTMAQWLLIIRLLNFGNIRKTAENLYLGALGMKLIRYYVPYIFLKILLEANTISRLDIQYHFQLSDLNEVHLLNFFPSGLFKRK